MTYKDDSVHRANPDPVEQRDRDLGRAEFRDPSRLQSGYAGSSSDDDVARRETRESIFSDTRDADEIERDIERTRADMDETLNALQRKLSPGQIIDEAMEYFNNGPGEFTANLSRRVKNNPLPVALVAIGIGWLMVSGNTETRTRTRYVTRYRYDDRYDASRSDRDVSGRSDDTSNYAIGAQTSSGSSQGTAGQGTAGSYGTTGGSTGASGIYSASSPDVRASVGSEGGSSGAGTYGSSGSGSYGSAAGAVSGSASTDRQPGRLAQAKHGVSDMAGRISETVGDYAHRASDVAQSAVQSVSGLASSATSGVSTGARGARRAVRRSGDTFSHLANERPLVLGAIGIAIGAVLGLVIPSTRREGELLGETRDELLDRAKEVGREQFDRVKSAATHVASAARDAAREEVERQGLITENGSASSSTGSSSASSSSSGKTEAERHGLGSTEDRVATGSSSSAETSKTSSGGSSSKSKGSNI